MSSSKKSKGFRNKIVFAFGSNLRKEQCICHFESDPRSTVKLRATEIRSCFRKCEDHPDEGSGTGALSLIEVCD
jgi:hypothetical protein